MKKLFLSIVAGVIIAAGAQAQHCAAANNTAHPHSYAQPGLYPQPDSLPCTVLGTTVSDTFYFQNFTSIPFGGSNYPVTSIKIDTISNLPPGLCWTSNVANNTFLSGDSGVIIVSGTPTGPVGQYKLHIIVDIVSPSIPFPITNQNAETAGLRYWVRTRCASATCTALDTTKHGNSYPDYIAYTACAGPPVAAISPAGPVTICAGASQTLTASAGTGYTYKWSTGATTQAITVSSAASYVVTVYNTAMDSAVSAPVAVNVAALPTVTLNTAGPDSICPTGDTATIAATATGVSYLWSNTATTSSIHVTQAGNYTVTVTDGNQCTATAGPVTVAFRPVPTATITRSGFTLTAGAASTYQWYQDGNLIAGANAQTYDVTINGNYTVEVTNAGGCSATSAAVAVVNVGVHDITGTEALGVYPNPTSGTFTLVTSGRTGDSYEIYDILGRPVQHGTISTDRQHIDLGAQQSGIYTITVSNGTQREAIRFTVVSK
ncbi:MAG: T9SS type A sorting domain-containing protein [Bacteroidetes bacterium]|nr:T9SS type A sorting domain-containing protein [Bacteroidota bacterium]